MPYTRTVQKFRLNVWDQPDLPRILIEGDSWADHPLVSNLAWSLNLYLDKRVNMLNISESGDLIYNMAHGKQFNKLQSYLGSSVFDFDIMFLSGGGNDILVNDVQRFKLGKMISSGSGTDPANYIDQTVWSELLKRVGDSYRKILSFVEQVNPNLKVVSHNYDYVYPRNKGADIIVIPNALGPWIYPVMCRKNIDDQNLQRQIIASMLDTFATMLKDLESEYDFFHVVNTLGTLPDFPKWGKKVHFWDDEIHPDSRGFGKLVKEKIGPYIESIL